MHCIKITFIAILVLSFVMSGFVGASDTDKTYLKAIGDYFKVGTEVVNDLSKQGVAIEDIPVVLLIANRTKASASQIAKVRARGDSWQGIIVGRSISTEIFYVMIAGEITSDLYAPVYEKFKSAASIGMTKIVFTDDEVVNMANLRFISSYYDYSVYEIMAMRDYGKDFPRITELVGQRKAEMIKKEKLKKKEAASTSSKGE